MLRLITRSEKLKTGVGDRTRLDMSPATTEYGAPRLVALKPLASPVKACLVNVFLLCRAGSMEGH